MILRKIDALQINTTSQVAKLTKGQDGLLKAIRYCVETSSIISFDVIVLVYYENVRKKYTIYRNWNNVNRCYDTEIEKDVLEEYQNLSATWTYHIRAMVKSWFLTNIGILVIKNKLVVIPTIDLE